ncbi:hypothetical protein BKA82DRAFT_27073 [Pisolithus tinctorius]|nr:hypothetical protein BKA82DRAFT_27073 [Pisolithus tinctorius]
MIINTFHYTGVSSKNVALDAPRLKEIINVVTNIENMMLAKNAQQELAYTLLQTLVWEGEDPP